MTKTKQQKLYKNIITTILIIQLLFSSTYPISSLFADEVIVDSSNTTNEVVNQPNDVVNITVGTSTSEVVTPIKDVISTTTPESLLNTVQDITQSTTTASSTSIITGDAVVIANILNLVNTNLVNSTGTVIFSNIYEGHEGDIDFRSPISFGSTTCTLTTCAEDKVLVKIKNNATIQNDIMLVAVTGNNNIEAAGHASIVTGDAYAGLNLVNLVNTNFINSNYFLISLNAFQNINGDIVFPTLSNFNNSFAKKTPANISDLGILNTGEIKNIIDIDTDTGKNSVTNVTNASIKTGTSSSLSTTYNNLNTTLTGGNNVSVLFKINGNWQGKIFGVPEGFGVVKGDDGSIYISSQIFGNATLKNNENISVHATNTAAIENNIHIQAFTGENNITGAETAIISTGNAQAGINVINIANGNVVGYNWMLAVLNIFGDFTGNIAFGRPDVWVGEKVKVPDRIDNGTLVTYMYTVVNKGDSIASNVTLTDDMDVEHVEIISASQQYDLKNGQIVWSLGSLPEGEKKEISYVAKIKNTIPGTVIENKIKVTQTETDNNLLDNTDSATFIASQAQASNSGGIGGNNTTSNEDVNVGGNNNGINDSLFSTLTISRKDPSVRVDIKNATVHQELVVKNNKSTTISHVVLYDVLRDSNGVEIHTEKWNIGDIKPFEEIILSYDIQFDANAAAGLYTLSTILTRNSKLEKIFPSNGTIELIKQIEITKGVPISNVFAHENKISISEKVTKKIKDNSTKRTLDFLSSIFETPKAEASENQNQNQSIQLIEPITSPFSIFRLIALLITLASLIIVLRNELRKVKNIQLKQNI